MITDLPRALALAGVLPSRDDWRRFLDRLLLWLGVALAAAGVICFFAYNWEELGRFGKFALIEAIVLAALVVLWRVELSRPVGKAALFAAALAVGALVALIGQTYQLGADTAETFLTWALLILPWVLVARFPALWLLWLGLLHVAVALSSQGWTSRFATVLGDQWPLWVLFGLDIAALAIWETLSRRGFGWLGERWAMRLLALASGIAITALAVLFAIGEGDWPALLGWLGWLAGIYFFYRRRRIDVFVLAGGVLSVVVVISAFFVRLWADHFGDEAWGLLLLMGLSIIALTAAGTWWLQQVLREVEA